MLNMVKNTVFFSYNGSLATFSCLCEYENLKANQQQQGKKKVHTVDEREK